MAESQVSEKTSILDKPFVTSPQYGTTAASPGGRSNSPIPTTTAAASPSLPPRHLLSIDDDLPNNVCTKEQLLLLPDFCLSMNKEKPLRHVTERGDVFHYALQPMFYSVFFILLIELFERFSFYGVNNTQAAFLTGVYDEDWNAGMESVSASSYVATSVAVAYITPFLGALLADTCLGDYWTVLTGSLFFYLPGLMLITLSTIPQLLGETFNDTALSVGLLLLWPMGTGMVKSVVNVFGAKQFHPLLQASLIESYYVKFYMCINIGALIGGLLVPVLAQYDVTMAYTFPVAMLCTGLFLFILGTPRYVRQRPKGDLCSKKKAYGRTDPEGAVKITSIFLITALVVPFNIAYSQMTTTFIIQGTVMQKAFGCLDASTMNNADTVSVLFFGYVIGNYFYPYLASRGIKIPTSYKFAIGSTFGALAISCALIVEHMIHNTYHATGGKVNVLWQAFSYIFIGIGEIFAVSTAYEVAFTASHPDQKVIASAINLFCIGGIPNLLCIGLYQGCKKWFRNSHGSTSISHIEDYATANVRKYFSVLLGICCFGMLVNLLPLVRNFIASIEEKAAESIKTPQMRRTPRKTKTRSSIGDSSDEESPMLRVKRHQAYLKYGSGPVLYKNGSMRAGPSLSKQGSARKTLKKAAVGKLYRQGKPKSPKIMLTAEGKPLMANRLYRSISASDLVTNDDNETNASTTT